jgi:hypothetical protein
VRMHASEWQGLYTWTIPPLAGVSEWQGLYTWTIPPLAGVSEWQSLYTWTIPPLAGVRFDERFNKHEHGSKVL